MSVARVLGTPGRRVLVVVEDPAFAELLVDALVDAGHGAARAEGLGEVLSRVQREVYDAAIVDFDTRARDGHELVHAIRGLAPQTTVIALLPCGGLPAQQPAPHYHLAIEKPARLQALLSALATSHAVSRN